MIVYFLIVAVIFMTYRVFSGIMFKKKPAKGKKTPVKTLIVIGSGGHTAEMITEMKNLNPKLYQPRLYVMADSDISSELKIKELELNFDKQTKQNFDIKKIPRSRVVNQSYFTSIFTTLRSILYSIPVVVGFKPDLILCNGPGTCIPICLIGFLCNALLFFDIKIIFIESICRVKTLSLSGKILLYFADEVIVQWPYLKEKFPQTVYLGRLV